MTRLKIYSKPRGAGDQTSGGRGKLLRATSDLSRIQILIRETLQNSWDAALEDGVPSYEVHVYRPQIATKMLMAREVFTDLPGSLQSLGSSLVDPEMHVIAIHDRGTTGLNGPVRAGEAAPAGEPNNFNSFVFDIGTTKSDRSSGGTFGFGKTAAFEVSRAHSVVYWSVCRTAAGELEHRIIACSLNDPYDQRGTRFTGVHWWGDPNTDEIVPLRGPAAQTLGEQLFETWFGEGETGTSIMVIDPEVSVTADEDEAAQRTPVRTSAHGRVLVNEILDSLARDAWPKFISMGSKHSPMRISVFSGDEKLNIAENIRADYSHFAASLTEIRSELGQLEEPADFHLPPLLDQKSYRISLRPRQMFGESRAEFFGGRSDSTVGILHLSLAPRDDSSRIRAPHNQLCLMRSKAELVVSYDPVLDIDMGPMQWTGVFKPTPECDFHFASSEPPTHDSWTPNTADSEVSAYVVRKTLESIKKKVRGFLQGQRVIQTDSEISVRDVSNALRGFVPLGLAGDDAESEKSRAHSRSQSKRRAEAEPRVNVIDYFLPEDDCAFVLDFEIDGNGAKEVALTAQPSARTSDGRMVLEPDEYRLEWEGQTAPGGIGEAVIFGDGDRGRLRIATRAEIAIDLEFEAEAR